MLYDDGRVALDDEGLTLRRYYFPIGRAKRIAYADIRDVESRSMGWMTGRLRLWGSTLPTRWLPLDAARTGKSTLVVLHLGARVRPAFSPDDPDEVLRLLHEHAPQLDAG